MASKSRWADTEEDVALAAKLKKEKEEKRRLKAEKARRIEAERQAKLAAQQQTATGAEEDGRPLKRRKTTPDPGQGGSGTEKDGGIKLLRFPSRSWGKCRSVENYECLNDIAEGTYGMVSRAKERASGRVVALKRLKTELRDPSGLSVTGLREIQILRDCKHENIVDLQEVVVGDDTSKIEKYVAPPSRPDNTLPFFIRLPLFSH